MRIFDPRLPLGQERPYLDGERALAFRVRAVLETRPGQIPWRPDFGCDIGSVVGFPATNELLSYARSQIRYALQRWLADVTVEDVLVRVVPVADQHRALVQRTVPLAESALLTLGIQATLEADIQIRGPSGLLTVTTSIEP